MRCSEESLRVYVGISEVADCSHRLIMSDELGDMFRLEEGFTADEVGLVGSTVGGRVLRSGDKVHAACRSLPMGFSWSLFYAQMTNQSVAKEGPF